MGQREQHPSSPPRRYPPELKERAVRLVDQMAAEGERHLDHLVLKKQWAAVLGVAAIPDDHYAVFKSLDISRPVNEVVMSQGEFDRRRARGDRLIESIESQPTVQVLPPPWP